MLKYSSANSATISAFIKDSNQIPKLPENLRNICEGKLGYGECCNVLKTFQKNKSPGNDGLTVEFYIAFWPLIGTLLVDSLNYAFEYGELSNSQKQAIITLIEKKGKDKRLIKNWRPISLINMDAKIIILKKPWRSVWKRPFLRLSILIRLHSLKEGRFSMRSGQ